MNYFGSGFITVLIYAYAGGEIEQQNAILTESSLNILTEDSKLLETEV